MAGSRKFLDSQFFLKFLRKNQKFLKKIWKTYEKNLKKIWKNLKFVKIREKQRKSLKIAAKQLVFLHFWYLGTAKSNEKLAENFENSSKTVCFHSVLNGWQQKISGFTIFHFFSDFFRKIFRNLPEFFQKFLKKKIEKKIEHFLKKIWKFLKNSWNSSKFAKSNAKSLKIAAFLHFWYLGTAKSMEN